MDLRENENEMAKLSQMLSKIQNLYYKKKDHLEELQLEISELRDVLNYLNSLISNKSFQSADEIYSESLIRKDDAFIEEQYFVEEIPKERVEGISIKRKIFSKTKENEEKLLCILNFYDLNKVEIKFLDPENRGIKETSENYIRIFLKDALIKIKEKNPNMSLEYVYYKDSDLIESISITKLNSMTEYDLITEKTRELLSKEIGSDN